MRGSGLGPAFCKELHATNAVVVYTDIPGHAERTEVVPSERLTATALSPGSRVWIKGEPYGWHAAEIAGIGSFGKYHVRIPGMPKELSLEPDQFKVRWNHPLNDPVNAVAQGFCDSPEFYKARRAFLDELALQRRASRGYTAALSAPVEFYQHQLDTVARVLSDPVLRYLLADEVGLGKTVEAGLVVRQLLLDDQHATALISVPSYLRGQWGKELRERLLLGTEMGEGRVRLISHEDLAGETGLTAHAVVVIDEAHRLMRYLADAPGLRKGLHRTKGLLLLSATPLSGNLSDLLGLLNLVDPVAYGIEDLESFEERIRQRETEANGLQILTSRRATSRMKNKVLEEIAGTYKNDPAVVEMVEDCRRGPDDTAAWDRLNSYVKETYRISRRMVRHRRRTGAAQDYPVVGRRPCFTPVEDPARAMIDEFLDFYRERLGDAVHLEAEERVGDLVTMVLHALAGPRALLHHLQQLQAGWDAAAQPDPLINAMIARLRGIDTGARTRAALDVIDDRLAKGLKVVAVSSSRAAAQEFHTAALDRWGEAVVAGHLAGMDQAARERETLAFVDTPQRALLVGDPTLEEGRNLQEAHVLVNLDLPLDPNQLEQRIGRLDRFALRTSPAEIVVLQEAGSAWVDGHIRLLVEGLGIFRDSVATVQRKNAEIYHEFTSRLLSRGSDALTFDFSAMKKEIAEEHDAVDLLETLESITSNTDFDDASMAELRDSEKRHPQLQSAFERFASARGGLGLQPRIDPQGPLLRFPLSPRSIPGLPDDLMRHVVRLLRRPRAYDRSVATSRNGVAPLRLGDPLVDWLEQHLRMDERGRARAIVRPSDDCITPSFWMSCDILVEFDETRLPADSQAVRRRLRRRGDALLPPRIIRVWADPHGVASPSLTQALDAPFDPDSDRVLRGPQWSSVLAALPDWRQLCIDSADTALDHVRALPDVATVPAAAGHRAGEETAARAAVLRARSQRLPTSAERHAAQTELQHELSLGRALRHGVESPAVSIIACGAVVLWPTA
ncbi:DEAD/DEAH box helicase [Actinomadura soli]|uniref:DEAD/DEAH box helicase n=1 Tax=Actinomadura soli TaxID=2508997 RepID=A0A5C4J897_9ACTN|nr:protein DpdE [Actinomadura soli]TMQ95286.1 DEAD/DEAH box helicase [Actinomadura soli]